MISCYMQPSGFDFCYTFSQSPIPHKPIQLVLFFVIPLLFSSILSSQMSTESPDNPTSITACMQMPYDDSESE